MILSLFKKVVAAVSAVGLSTVGAAALTVNAAPATNFSMLNSLYTSYSYDYNLPNVPAGTDVFNLSSNPGASKTLYLDFKPTVLDHTVWNGYFKVPDKTVVPGYNLDDDVDSFNPTEQKNIYNMWVSISEAYAWSDLNVTTVAPTSQDAMTRTSTGDNTYGMTAFISSSSYFNNSNTGCKSKCAGISVQNAMTNLDSTNPSQRYVIVAAQLNNLVPNLSMVATHEFGHTVGLSHDGTVVNGVTSEYFSGNSGWCPIMGSCYNRAFTSFDNGSYANANNHEDDFAVMAAHGLTSKVDTEGDSQFTAFPLSRGFNSNHFMGSNDVDWFSYNSPGGAFTVNAAPKYIYAGMSLDLDMTVYDATGKQVAYLRADGMSTAIPMNTNASWSAPANSKPGVYYFRVSGPGNSVLSHYGDVGDYNVTVS